MEAQRQALLVLDPERFRSLSPSSSSRDWKKVLEDTGLLYLDTDPSAVGQLILRLQQGLKPRKRLNLRPVLALLGSMAFIALGIFLLAVMARSGAGIFCFGIFLVGPGLLRRFLGRGADDRLRSWIYHETDHSEEMYGTLQELLSRDFMQPMGPILLENVPTRQWLGERLEALARSAAELERREQGMLAVQARIREVNRQLGRPQEDPETEALAKALEDLRESRARLSRLQAELSARRVELEERLAARRLAVERQMLSLHVDQLRERGIRVPELPALEVELAAMRQQVEELDQQLQIEQARITADLEVRKELEGPTLPR